MTNKERKLQAIKDTRGEKAQEVQELWALDTPENDLDEDQKARVLELTKEIEGLKKDQVDAEAAVELEKEVNTAAGNVKNAEEEETSALKGMRVGFEPPPQQKSIGQQFVESDAYQSMFGDGKNFPSGQWSTSSVELNTKSTVQSGGTLDGYANYQQNLPGVIPIAAEPLTVADLMPSSQATAPQVQFFKELTATNAAAATAESGTKPESAFDFKASTANVKKISTFLPVADEMLEDAPGIQAYLNNRLTAFIRTEEERELLRGDQANSDEILGFCGNTVSGNYSQNSVGSAVIAGTAASNAGSAVYTSLLGIINNQRGSSFLDPDALIMNPREFGTLLSRYDTAGQFYGGGPFSFGPYGNASQQNTNRLMNGPSIWGVPIHVTSAILAGTMLLGCFRQGAEVWRRGGVSVSASNSHASFFQQNQTAIRAEERLALTIYRPEAFTVVTWA